MTANLVYNMVMKVVNVAEAKARLSELLDQVETGETITIARRNEPIAELRPVVKRRRELRPWGLAKGQFTVPEGFNDPLPDWLLDAFEGKSEDK